MKSEKLLEGLKVAPNLKRCSKVAEQLMDSLRGGGEMSFGVRGLSFPGLN